MDLFITLLPLIIGVLLAVILWFKLRLKFIARLVISLSVVAVSCCITLCVNMVFMEDVYEDVHNDFEELREMIDDADDVSFESTESSSKHSMDEFSNEMQEYFESWDDQQPHVFADLLYQCADALNVPISEVSIADPSWGGEDLHRCSRFNVGDVVVDIYMNTDESGEVYGYLEIE